MKYVQTEKRYCMLTGSKIAQVLAKRLCHAGKSEYARLAETTIDNDVLYKNEKQIESLLVAVDHQAIQAKDFCGFSLWALGFGGVFLSTIPGSGSQRTARLGNLFATC